MERAAATAVFRAALRGCDGVVFGLRTGSPTDRVSRFAQRQEGARSSRRSTPRFSTGGRRRGNGGPGPKVDERQNRFYGNKKLRKESKSFPLVFLQLLVVNFRQNTLLAERP